MRKIKMSKELFDFLKSNKTEGRCFAFWPENFKVEFGTVKQTRFKFFKFYDNGNWIESGCSTAMCDRAYTLADDVELLVEEEYIYCDVTTNTNMCQVFSYRVIVNFDFDINFANSFKTFRGFEYDTNPGEFVPALDYTKGNVTRVRFLKM